jgi:hypothetical protein
MSEASRKLRTMSSFQDTPPEIAYLDPSQPESTQDDPRYRRRIAASTRLRANGVRWPDTCRVTRCICSPCYRPPKQNCQGASLGRRAVAVVIQVDNLTQSRRDAKSEERERLGVSASLRLCVENLPQPPSSLSSHLR